MLTLNKNYNPNDPNSKRWINEPTVAPNYKTSPKIYGEGTQNGLKSLLSNVSAPFKTLGTTTPNKNTTTTVAPPVVEQPEKDVINNGSGIVTPTKIDPSVLALQKQLNAKGAGLKEDGIMGPLTQAAMTRFNGGGQNNGIVTPQSNTTELPKGEDGAIDYVKLAQQAGQAGLSLQDYLGVIQGQAMAGTEEYGDIYKNLGIPDLVNEVYKKPSKTTQAIYEDYYNQSKLGDVKNSIAQLDEELKTIRDGYTTAIKEHQDNPWLSASTRSARIAREKEIYGQREANTISLRSSYLDQYNLGVSEIEKVVGRIAGDLEADRSLDTDRLNYLLGEAERTAGLLTTDATKQGLRYSGDYLSSRQKEKVAEEDRAFNKQVALKKMDSSTDVAKAIENLGKNNPSAGGYFNALNNILAIKDSTPQKSSLAMKTLTGYLNDGNETQAREYLQQLALGGLSATDRSDAMKRTGSINAIIDIKEKLNDYAQKYGDTNIINGTFQNIQQSLGTAGNPDAAELNRELTELLQRARVDVTGAAWGKQEDAEYKRINANIKNTNKLNMAILDSSLDILNRNNSSAISWVIGNDTYDQIYRPKPKVTATTTLPAFYSSVDMSTQAAIDEMVMDGVPEADILELFR